MLLHDRYATWTEIDLKAIEENVRYFVGNTRKQVMAIVKANGHGHGAVQVTKAALRGGATWCGVARIGEALELRDAGINCPILMLGLMPKASMADMIDAQISITVWEKDQIEEAAAAASRIGRQARLHLKVDTGMGRLGVQPLEAPALARHLADTQGVLFEGLFTHFARADEHNVTPTDKQEQLFLNVLDQLGRNGLHPSIVHTCNSAASLKRPSAFFDLIRVGIAVYGLHPSPQCPLPGVFHPALSWKTQLCQVKVMAPGSGISYGHMYKTSRKEKIGTIPVGYADGFRRVEGNVVLIGGTRVPVVGRMCMDYCMVQLDSVPDARPGDEVVLIGSQGREHISVEEVAERWETNNFEVTCGISTRVPRLYI